MVEPTIPNATKYHEDRLLPVKNVSFELFLDVKYDTPNNRRIKQKITIKTNVALINLVFQD
jgi:hypothetical protein